MRAPFRYVAPLIVWCLGSGCDDEPEPKPDQAAAAPKAPDTPAPEAATEPQVEVPLGELGAGTRPGRFSRDPALEPTQFKTKLGPFEIDRDLYPNQPGKPPLLGASQEEASRLCGEAGGRLCTELEWERACKGPENDPFPGGDTWSAECSGACASGFGVLNMGRFPEWTASMFGPGSVAEGKPVLRGPESEQVEADAHRCAHRSVAPGKPTTSIGFRCCHEAPNGARVPEPKDGTPYTRLRLTGERIKELLAGHPKTADLAEDLVLFGEPEAINTVIARGPGDKMGFNFTTQALRWQPSVGAEFLVLAAKSGKDRSFVLAYHAVGDEEYELASSFIMNGEEGPVILAYSDSIRPRLHFSNCWGCPGETGKVLFRQPDRAVVLQP